MAEARELTGYVLWGATGQAKVLRECLTPSALPLVAVFDNDPAIPPPFSDVPLFCGPEGFNGWLATLGGATSIGFLVAIGGERGEDRLQIQAQLAAHRLRPLVARHRTAFVASSAVVDEGTQVLANAAVCVDVQLGRACIINTGAVVDHECHLAEGVHICPGARLAGLVKVERCATIGTGAVILPRVHIGEGAVVGAGAVVLRDVPDRAVVVGNPAHQIGEREPACG